MSILYSSLADRSSVPRGSGPLTPEEAGRGLTHATHLINLTKFHFSFLFNLLFYFREALRNLLPSQTFLGTQFLGRGFTFANERGLGLYTTNSSQ